MFIADGSYHYNAQGLRTRKITAQGTTVFHYDLAGQLIAESDANGTLLRRYVYSDGHPLALLEQNAVRYLHGDRLGAPIAASDDGGTLVWRWNHDAFGEAIPDTDPDGDGNPVELNLRFPGQYADGESGLYYNWHRYYDPQTGRYITSDPIGLEGGLNTYTYVGNNPIMYYDPYGLWAWGDPIDQDIVDGVSGFGDTMSFNATNWIRDQAGWNGSVDKCSSAYAGGQWTGVGFGLAMGGAGLGQAGFRAEMGAWKQGGQWFAGGKKMPHFHFGNGPGMGKHHLPYQVSSWYKNFAANVRRGVVANDLRSFGGAIYGFGVAVFGTETNQ